MYQTHRGAQIKIHIIYLSCCRVYRRQRNTILRKAITLSTGIFHILNIREGGTAVYNRPGGRKVGGPAGRTGRAGRRPFMAGHTHAKQLNEKQEGIAVHKQMKNHGNKWWSWRKFWIIGIEGSRVLTWICTRTAIQFAGSVFITSGEIM